MAVAEAAARVAFSQAVISFAGTDATPNNDMSAFLTYSGNLSSSVAVFMRNLVLDQRRMLIAEERELAALERLVSRVESAAATGYRR